MLVKVLSNILVARVGIVATVALASLLGGLFVVLTATPGYDARARVMLRVAGADPITGAQLDRRTVDPYLQSQLNFVRELPVLAMAVEAVGWLDDPDIIEAYNQRPVRDQRVLSVWLAQQVAESLRTSFVDGSNILEIRYRGASPEAASLVADAVRTAYIEQALQERRRSAFESAAQQAERANQIRVELAKLDAQKRAIEAETGILLPRSGLDYDSQALVSLAEPPAPGKAVAPFIVSRSTRAPLAQIELELAQANQTLGVNHPRIRELQATRDRLEAQADAEADDGSEAAAAVRAAEAAKAKEFDRVRERVLSQRQDVLRLRLVQDQINLKADAYDQAIKRVADLRQLAAATESGLTPIGEVEVDETRAYPNPVLVLGGTGGIGLIMGVLLALLLEALNLRVRTVQMLRVVVALPVLGVVPRLSTQGVVPNQRGAFGMLFRRYRRA